MALYKVLKDGIRQRTNEGAVARPTVGEIIKVSDIAARRLIATGWIAAQGGETREVAETQEGGSRRERKAKRRFTLGLGKSEAPAPEAVLENSEAPAAPATGDAPKGDAPEEA